MRAIVSLRPKAVLNRCGFFEHMNPCGIGQADDIETAWDYALRVWDLVSIFGGIVVLNREDAATAEKLCMVSS